MPKPEIPHVTYQKGFRVNPSHPQGGRHFNRGHVLYAVSVNSGDHAGFVTVASTRWLRDWQPGNRVTVKFGVHDTPVSGQLRGIVKCQDGTIYGHVPNVPTPFWVVG